MSDATIREQVKEHYGKAARAGGGCCGEGAPKVADPVALSQAVGYDPAQLASVPEEANLGLGCGNPSAVADLKPGEVVLDLGSGAGLDALLAAEQVGPTGRVIGVDMTPEMLARAREQAVKAGVADRVEFREGHIEQLPVVDASVDVILSNCVINLSPDKPQVFREAYRVLKPGGRLAISDLLLTQPLPEELRADATLYMACVGGASLAEEYLAALGAAGFQDVAWTRKPMAPLLDGLLADPTIAGAAATLGEERLREVAETVFSYQIGARKP